MSKIARIRIFVVVAAMTLLTVPIASAESAPETPAAPIPVQMLAAKKVFIANGYSPLDTALESPNQAYNEFYAQIKSWGKYELVSAPGDADLVFEIGSVFLTGPTSVTNGSGGSTSILQLRLTAFDLKTHVVLWTFTEQVQGWNRKATGLKNFDQAMGKLVDDVKTLTTPAATTAKAPSPNQ
jgi:hypothetical protein